MSRILCILIGYGFGLIQSAFIVGKIYKVDMRQLGSKNLGTTNTVRTLGPKAGLVVFIMDMAKSVVAICITYAINYYFFNTAEGLELQYQLIALYTGFGVMLGHNYPFYLKFKGGKGVACSIGTLLMFNPLLVLVLAVIGIPIVYFTRYISLASIVTSICSVPVAYLLGYRGETLYVLGVISAFIIWKHRSNIKRLIDGNENKFKLKKEV